MLHGLMQRSIQRSRANEKATNQCCYLAAARVEFAREVESRLIENQRSTHPTDSLLVKKVLVLALFVVFAFGGLSAENQYLATVAGTHASADLAGRRP
jgi:hypothetical protein